MKSTGTRTLDEGKDRCSLGHLVVRKGPLDAKFDRGKEGDGNVRSTNGSGGGGGGGEPVGWGL